MMAGINCLASIWRWLYVMDDRVGGAHPTGTYVYQDVRAFMQEDPEEQLLLQQGLEIEKTFHARLIPGYLDIRERDEFEITAPSDHVHLGDRFRIINARPSVMNRRDPRNYLLLTLVRSEQTHEQQ